MVKTQTIRLRFARGLRRLGDVFVFLAVLAVVAPLVPTAGAIFDHHFAERMPDHDHIYHGRPDLKHGHAYELPHADVSSAAPIPRPEGASVVVLPSDSASRAGPVAEIALSLEAADLDWIVAEPALIPVLVAQVGSPRAVFLAPPKTPPRTPA